jgi:biotin operon repressor
VALRIVENGVPRAVLLNFACHPVTGGVRGPDSHFDISSDYPHYLRQIISSAWKPGDLVPGDLELCAELGVSRTTVRQALAELAHDGWVVRQRGRGTFVAPPKLTERAVERLSGFFEDMVALGQMCTILVGGIDLSVGGLVSFISVAFILLIKPIGYFAYPVCIAAGVLAGYINGVILTRIKIPSFIATLGTGGILTSLAYLVSPRPVNLSPELYGLVDIVNGSLFKVSNVLLVGLAVLILFYVILRFTSTGSESSMANPCNDTGDVLFHSIGNVLRN